MQTEAPGMGAPGVSRRFWYVFCCTLATIQLVWVYLSRVPSELNLPAFEHGLERTPFQYRLLLMEPLRLAHASPAANGLAAWLTGLPAWFPRGVSPEGVLEAAIDLASLLIASGIAYRLYAKTSKRRLLGWLVWPLVLSLSLLAYAGGAHHGIRFVYDLPSMALFTLCLFLLHEGGEGWLFFAVFALATLNRETTLLLLPFLLLRDRVRGTRLRTTLWRALPPAVFWTALHVWLVHRFAANPGAGGPRFWLNLGSLLIPLSWPQASSALGYLWPFLFLYRRFLPDPILRSWLHGYWVWLAFMTVFGLLVETRVFGELIPLTACMATLLLEECLAAKFVQDGRPTLAKVYEPFPLGEPERDLATLN